MRAGIVILHDALELVLLACLAEKKIIVPDKDIASVQKLTEFIDKNIGPVPNWTKLMGMNPSRGGIKHFGNTLDTYSAKDFLNKTQETINYLIFSTFGKHYYEIFSAELIQHEESRKLLTKCSQILEQEQLEAFECLTNIRKAIFINFEEDFSVEEWSEIEEGKGQSFLKTIAFKYKAPYYTKNKEWITKNVMDVFDYIQINDSALRSELMEYGISIVDFFNLLRLTPKVFRHKGSNFWKFEGNFTFLNCDKEYLSYCLSVAIDAILMKENYLSLHKYTPEKVEFDIVTISDTDIYEKASIQSKKIYSLKKGEKLETHSFMPSLDDETSFVKISYLLTHPQEKFIRGYILENHVTNN
jgi:hypothetical protein